MGRIKSLLVKRSAKQLNNQMTTFTESYEHNKKLLGKDNLPSKSVRNKIAGYIARLNKMKRLATEREARRLAREEEKKAKLAEIAAKMQSSALQADNPAA
jgi:small subunit ribosomal protein S17e